MNNVLKLQELDERISACLDRESEIPKQKNKSNIYRERLKAELAEREESRAALELEQRDSESEIEQRKGQIDKYQGQLAAVKKNDEYQALLHEIDQVKKQIGVKEERILAIMMEMEDANARLEADKSRIDGEMKDIDKQCAEIDAELAEAIKQRAELEAQRQPIADLVSSDILTRYDRLRRKFKSGLIVVALRQEVCTGCNVHVRPQIVNEILQGNKIHACQQCGRLLYHPENFAEASEATEEAASQGA